MHVALRTLGNQNGKDSVAVLALLASSYPTPQKPFYHFGTQFTYLKSDVAEKECV